MAAATKIDIKNRLLSGSTALGNSKRGLKEVCSDLLNDYGKSKNSTQDLVSGTFLCAATLDRMRQLDDTENGDPYRPNADTCERILRFFGAEMTFDQIRITPKFQNHAKVENVNSH